MLFDTDTLRMAAGWSNSADEGKSKQRSSTPSGQNFIDWRGIQFNGEHGIESRKDFILALEKLSTAANNCPDSSERSPAGLRQRPDRYEYDSHENGQVA
jgi:hypothetical protein